MAAQLALGGQTWRTSFSGPGSNLGPSGHRTAGSEAPQMQPGTSSRRPLLPLTTQGKSELGAPKRGARAGSPRGFVDPKQLLRWAGPKSGAGLALGATENTSKPVLGSSSVARSETQILSLQSSDKDLQNWARELQIRKGTSGHTAQRFSQEEQLAQGPRALGGRQDQSRAPPIKQHPWENKHKSSIHAARGPQ